MLVGDPAHIDALVDEHRETLAQQRTVRVAPGDATGLADVVVLLGPDGVEDVAFVGGDETLRDRRAAIRAADFDGLLPIAPAKLLRRGALSCSSATGEPACALVLLPAGSARPADAGR